MDRLVCQKDMCTGCMACVDICPREAITIKDSIFTYNAEIDPTKCIQCGMCYRVCTVNHTPFLEHPRIWQQGWSKDEEIRKHSASGGVAMALAKTFIQDGGLVCSCTFQNGKFIFKVVDSLEGLRQFSGSKYVKSSPVGAYKAVKEKVSIACNVLFIGLPCQVAAMKKYVGEKYEKYLYTVDLVCHGTPSPKCLEDYFKQYKISLNNLENISFRFKKFYGVNVDEKTLVCPGVTDSYLTAFSNALNYTESCYQCKYAQILRAGDITVADAWGSELPYEERAKGISLVLGQTEKGICLLEHAKLQMFSIDLDKAITTHPQLRAPNMKTDTVKHFIKTYGKCSFNSNVFLHLPQKRMKQGIKYVLHKMGLTKLFSGADISFTIQLK